MMSRANGTFFKSGRPARSPSITRDEQAAQRAAWKRYEAADVEEAAGSGSHRGVAWLWRDQGVGVPNCSP